MWRELRECLRARRFRAILLLHTTCVLSLCTWRASCVAAKHTNKNCFTHRSVKIFRMLSQEFFPPGSDPLHKIMRYRFYSSTLQQHKKLSWWFQCDQNGQREIFCPAPQSGTDSWVLSSYGGVGYFSNERGFSMESSLQRSPSNFLLWKRNDSSVVW